MKGILLHIYDWLGTHKRELWTVLIAVIVVMSGLTLSLGYHEDIMDFLPLTAEDRAALERFRSQESAARLVLVIEGDSLREEALDALYEALPDLTDPMEDGQMVADFYTMLPYHISDNTYARFDSLFTPEAIRAALQRDKLILSTPGTSFLVPALQNDPLGLVELSAISKQLPADRSYAFYNSPYGSTETIRNAELLDSLTAVTAAVAKNYPSLQIRWTGAPVISVANARRIKLDSFLCIGLSLILISALLVYAFPRRRDIGLILLSVSFGWFFGMAVLRLFTPAVSAIVLGIGSVLIGIAVNYPLHLLVHQRYTTSVRQTLDEVLSPLVVGNITTVGAFMALIPLQATALRHLGIFAAAMLVGTILFCIFVLPHMMSAEPTPVREFKVRIESQKVLPSTPINVERLKVFGQWSTIILTVLFGVILIVNRKSSNRQLFDSDLHHINYITDEQDAEMNALEALPGDVSLWTAYWQAHDPEETIAQVQEAAIEAGFRPDAFEPFYRTLRTFEPVPLFDMGTIAERLSADFDYIGLCCSIIVFVFLLLSFRSLWLALIAFIPMALSWIWIIAIMQLFGLQFNIVNIILATFIFGQGDDYTIFIVEGLLYEHRTGKPMLPQYRQSIILSALIMLVGIGILVLAVHPALHSLGVVTLIGMTIVLLMAMTIPPLLFKGYTYFLDRNSVEDISK